MSSQLNPRSLGLNPSAQQVFTHIQLSLRDQEKPSYNVEMLVFKNPRYRSSSGTKCAIGHCISDDAYQAKLENNTISQLFGQGYLKGPLAWMADPEMLPLLELLQEAHDDYMMKSMEKWEERMKSIAAVTKLVYVQPTKEGTQ